MIVLDQIQKSYRTPQGARHVVLKGLQLSLNAGEFMAVVGPSGSGKSTLLNVLGLMDQPDSGQYRFEDRDVLQLKEKERAAMRNRYLGFVFQQFHLLPQATALENIALPLLYGSAPFSLDAAREQLNRVGLADFADYFPSQLSGGQQQRIAIARAMVNRPKLILADEPTGNLDTENANAIFRLFQKAQEEGCCILMITHDAALAERADRQFYLHDGCLTVQTPMEVTPC
ncbi:MAG: ABC transporter ATP-binding protein [Acidobacteria bacterium]|nr:ABC transporter ATP-binding protein [Acidobacteriota bacterium]